MVTWSQILAALGKLRESTETHALIQSVGAESLEDRAPDDTEVYLHFHSRGVSLLFDDDQRLTTVFLYVRAVDGFDACTPGAATSGIRPADTSADVVGRLGWPSARTVRSKALFNQPIPESIRYDRPDHALHVSFDPTDGGAALVSCLHPDVAP